MSLLEWKKLAKQKIELGNKINFVHDTILKINWVRKQARNLFKSIQTNNHKIR